MLHPLPTPLILSRGRHKPDGEMMCVMEAVSVRAGEPWSDHPATAGPVLGEFMRVWNDDIGSTKRRTQLLVPYIDKLVGAAGTPEVEERRRWMAVDWLVRSYAPTWLDLTPTLTEHAAALRGLDEITNAAGNDAAVPTIRAARAAAWVARSAAGTGDANAARAAIWAVATAIAVTRSGTSQAVWAAAQAAGGGAIAGYAASDSTKDAFKSTRALIEVSACDLLDRMIATRVP